MGTAARERLGAGVVLMLAGLLAFAAGARAADPVIAAAGDIACAPELELQRRRRHATKCRQSYTSDLLVNAGLRAVLPLGDDQYESGSLLELQQVLRPDLGAREVDHPPGAGQPRVQDGGRGRATSTTSTASAQPTGPAGDRGQGYYSFDVGSWHLIALNSN